MDGDGLQVPPQGGGVGGHPVRVPTADCVSVESVLQVWVKVTPSQTVDGAGSHPAGQMQCALVVSVPIPSLVRELFVEQVCV